MVHAIGVSSCFLLESRYNETRVESPHLLPFFKVLRKYGISPIPVCPEQLGGLSTPRPPVELVGDRAVSIHGEDLTLPFCNGAQRTLQLFQDLKITVAVLKQRSPSCGCGKIYDGSFTGRIISGNGKTTETLLNAGITVYTEEDLKDLSFLANHFPIEPI